MKWTEFSIASRLVVGPWPRFPYRPNFACVPNVSWGLDLDHEADLIVCSKRGYLTEVEIKVTFADWKKDHTKAQFHRLGIPWPGTGIKTFWYAVPAKLAQRHTEITLPPGAGVLAMNEDRGCDVVVPAVDNAHAKPINAEQMLQLARLATMRMWDMRRVLHDRLEEIERLRKQLDAFKKEETNVRRT